MKKDFDIEIAHLKFLLEQDLNKGFFHQVKCAFFECEDSKHYKKVARNIAKRVLQELMDDITIKERSRRE